jgi:hypothetical protein
LILAVVATTTVLPFLNRESIHALKGVPGEWQLFAVQSPG